MGFLVDHACRITGVLESPTFQSDVAVQESAYRADRRSRSSPIPGSQDVVDTR